MHRLTRLTFEDWIPFASPRAIAVLDLTVSEAIDAFGWRWIEVEEDGLGLMHYLPLAWDGKRRYLLSASDFYPEDGLAVEVDVQDDPTSARADLLSDLELDPNHLLAINEGTVWFARWDPPHQAGTRPSTARKRR